MKKVIKNISRILFSLLLIFSVFSIVNVVAEEAIFQITNISVKEKSDKVTVNDVSISGGELNNDIIFTNLNDYIKYNITIKNVSDDTYTIKSISDNNNSNYLEYTYDDLSGVKVESGNTKTFELQIKYIQETSDLTISDQAVSLILTYEKEDGTTGSEVITNNSNNDSSNVVGGSSDNIINPKTGDNITLYLLLGIVSLVGLCVTTVNRRQLNKSLMSIAVLSMVVIPFGVKADSERFEITFATNKIENSYSELISGKDYIIAIFKLLGHNSLEWKYDDWNRFYFLADVNYTEDDDEYWEPDIENNIKYFKYATDEEYNSVKDNLTDDNIVSTDNSNVSIYSWIDNDILYVYSIAKKIYFNSDSSELFSYFRNLESIDLSRIDSSNVVNAGSMFLGLSNLTSLDLTNFDTSNMTNMKGMFAACSSLTELDLSNFDTSKVTVMSSMFFETTMEVIDISSFDTSNVKDMRWMFGTNFSTTYLKTVYVSDKFSTESVEDNDGFNYVFQKTSGLIGGAGTTFDEDSYSYEYAHIDGGSSNPGFLTDIADKPQS